MNYSYKRFLKPSYEPGELIVTARPYVTSVFPSERKQHCANCLVAGSTIRAGSDDCAKLAPCTACGWAHYCGPLCERAAWSSAHWRECALLRAWRGRGREREQTLHRALLLFRIIFFESDVGRRSPGEAGDSSSRSADPYDTVDDPGWRRSHKELLSHKDEHALRPDLYRHVTDCLEAFCSASAEVAAALPPLDDLLESLGRMRTNCFEIYGARGDVVAEGMYLSPSLFDHSCLPNASYTTADGTLLEVRAVRRIDTSVEPILISYYGDQRLRSTSERQRFFSDGYFFECGCSRCDRSPAAQARDRRLRSARCVLGDECRKLTSCDHCESTDGGDADSAKAAAAELEIEASQAAADTLLLWLGKATRRGRWKLVVNEALRYLLDAGASLGVCNARTVRVRERLVAACYELPSEWRLGVEHGLVLLDVYTSLCPEAVIYVGKLQLMIGAMLRRGRRFDEAERRLSEGAATLRIACGPDHPLTAQCRHLLTAVAVEKAASGQTVAA